MAGEERGDYSTVNDSEEIVEDLTTAREGNNHSITDRGPGAELPGKDHPITHALSPLLTAMKFTGTFYDSSASRVHIVYPIIVSTLLWVHFILLFGWHCRQHPWTPGVFIFMILIHCSCLQHSVLSVICFFFSRKYNSFVNDWRLLFGEDKDAFAYHRLRRWSWFLFVVSTSIAIQAQVLIAMWQQMIGVTRSNVPTLMTSFYGDQAPPIAVLITYHIILVYIVSGSLFPYCIFITFCITFYTAYRMVLNKLRKIVEDSTIDFDSIEAIRRNYISVCQQISCVNSCFKYYTFTVYVTGLPTLCFSTYELHFAWTSMDPGIKIAVCVVICTEAFMILVMTFAATLVGHAAKLPQRQLHRIKLDQQQHHTAAATYILFFLNQVSQTGVGFSSGGLFYITKRTLIILLTMMFSYAILLLKFGNKIATSESGGAAYNSTKFSSWNVTDLL